MGVDGRLQCNSLRPHESIVALRTYLRHRERMVEFSASHIQYMQKALMQSVSTATGGTPETCALQVNRRRPNGTSGGVGAGGGQLPLAT